MGQPMIAGERSVLVECAPCSTPGRAEGYRDHADGIGSPSTGTAGPGPEGLSAIARTWGLAARMRGFQAARPQRRNATHRLVDHGHDASYRALNASGSRCTEGLLCH